MVNLGKTATCAGSGSATAENDATLSAGSRVNASGDCNANETLGRIWLKANNAA